MTILKSIGAILAGVVVVVILSYGTDYLVGAGSLDGAAVSFILLIITYRTVYSAIGCYIIAALAPNYPMRHALFVGIFGCALSVIATINIGAGAGPTWYGYAVGILSIPAAWLGAVVYSSSQQECVILLIRR